jgi:hypothetical protein
MPSKYNPTRLTSNLAANLVRSAKSLLLVAGALLGASTAIALQLSPGDRAPLTAEVEKQVVHAFAEALERYFLFPEVGKAYGVRLRARQAAGAYRALTAAKLARALTDDAQSVYQDGHLRLRAPSQQALLGAPSAAKSEQESTDTGIERAGWIADGVAYISFNLFPSSKASLAAVRSFLAQHSTARALILDVRTHGGGYTDEFDVLASYLYDRPTELMYFDTRIAAFRAKPDTPTLRRISGPPGFARQVHLAAPAPQPTRLARTNVFVLTSGYTGSAAEHLALALKRTGRATLVGEVTAGMGHFGRVVELPGGFSAVIPIGRPFDPSTNEGWEGTGVQPHVSVPAKEALDAALLRLEFDAREAKRLSTEWMPRGDMSRVMPLRASPN